MESMLEEEQNPELTTKKKDDLFASFLNDLISDIIDLNPVSLQTWMRAIDNIGNEQPTAKEEESDATDEGNKDKDNENSVVTKPGTAEDAEEKCQVSQSWSALVKQTCSSMFRLCTGSSRSKTPVDSDGNPSENVASSSETKDDINSISAGTNGDEESLERDRSFFTDLKKGLLESESSVHSNKQLDFSILAAVPGEFLPELDRKSDDDDPGVDEQMSNVYYDIIQSGSIEDCRVRDLIEDIENEILIPELLNEVEGEQSEEEENKIGANVESNEFLKQISNILKEGRNMAEEKTKFPSYLSLEKIEEETEQDIIDNSDQELPVLKKNGTKSEHQHPDKSGSRESEVICVNLCELDKLSLLTRTPFNIVLSIPPNSERINKTDQTKLNKKAETEPQMTENTLRRNLLEELEKIEQSVSEKIEKFERRTPDKLDHFEIASKMKSIKYVITPEKFETVPKNRVEKVKEESTIMESRPGRTSLNLLKKSEIGRLMDNLKMPGTNSNTLEKFEKILTINDDEFKATPEKFETTPANKLRNSEGRHLGEVDSHEMPGTNVNMLEKFEKILAINDGEITKEKIGAIAKGCGRFKATPEKFETTPANKLKNPEERHLGEVDSNKTANRVDKVAVIDGCSDRTTKITPEKYETVGVDKSHVISMSQSEIWHITLQDKRTEMCNKGTVLCDNQLERSIIDGSREPKSTLVYEKSNHIPRTDHDQENKRAVDKTQSENALFSRNQSTSRTRHGKESLDKDLNSSAVSLDQKRSHASESDSKRKLSGSRSKSTPSLTSNNELTVSNNENKPNLTQITSTENSHTQNKLSDDHFLPNLTTDDKIKLNSELSSIVRNVKSPEELINKLKLFAKKINLYNYDKKYKIALKKLNNIQVKVKKLTSSMTNTEDSESVDCIKPKTKFSSTNYESVKAELKKKSLKTKTSKTPIMNTDSKSIPDTKYVAKRVEIKSEPNENNANKCRVKLILTERHQQTPVVNSRPADHRKKNSKVAETNFIDEETAGRLRYIFKNLKQNVNEPRVLITSTRIDDNEREKLMKSVPEFLQNIIQDSENSQDAQQQSSDTESVMSDEKGKTKELSIERKKKTIKQSKTTIANSDKCSCKSYGTTSSDRSDKQQQQQKKRPKLKNDFEFLANDCKSSTTSKSGSRKNNLDDIKSLGSLTQLSPYDRPLHYDQEEPKNPKYVTSETKLLNSITYDIIRPISAEYTKEKNLASVSAINYNPPSTAVTELSTPPIKEASPISRPESASTVDENNKNQASILSFQDILQLKVLSNNLNSYFRRSGRSYDTIIPLTVKYMYNKGQGLTRQQLETWRHYNSKNFTIADRRFCDPMFYHKPILPRIELPTRPCSTTGATYGLDSSGQSVNKPENADVKPALSVQLSAEQTNKLENGFDLNDATMKTAMDSLNGIIRGILQNNPNIENYKDVEEDGGCDQLECASDCEEMVDGRNPTTQNSIKSLLEVVEKLTDSSYKVNGIGDCNHKHPQINLAMQNA